MDEPLMFFEFPMCPHQFEGWCRDCVRFIVDKEREPVKIKTMGVKFAEIHYGCGCVSEMQKMVYCSVHSGLVNKAAVAEAVREAYERAAKTCNEAGCADCANDIRALSKGGGE